MNEHLLIGIAGIVVLGISAQWIAWKLGLPSILLLLIFGFIAGPVTGFLNPDEILGDVLFPLVSVAVALILFEGGLSLKISELRQTAHVVRNLVTIGSLITWTVSALGAYYILHFDLSIAILFGAILVVTGPTVIIPLLRHVKATGKISSIVKWEGIVNDPIGAILAVLVLEAILIGGFGQTIFSLLISILTILLIGALLGGFGALIVILFLRRFWVPGYLQSSVTLMIVVGIFSLSNVIHSESGLLAVTLMGIIMANQKQANIKHIIQFKENLGILLLSSLFIILAARLQFESLSSLGWNSVWYLLLLILIVRPLAVLFSTFKSGLNWKEKLFIGWMAPRGIVAAAVTAVFALELIEKADIVNARLMVPEMFFIIVGTVAIYGLCAAPLGRLLGLAASNPQGVLIAGSHLWAREIAQVLKDEKFNVLMIDTNRQNITEARLLGIPTFYGSILSDYITDEYDLGKYGNLLALTPNDEVNSLATIHFNEQFGQKGVYQLVPGKKEKSKKESVSKPLRGRLLFTDDANYDELERRFYDGYKIKKTKITDEFDYDDYQYLYDAIPLFLIDEDEDLNIITVDEEVSPSDGDILISLVKEKEENNKGE